MKTLIKILIVLASFGGALMAQTVNPAVGSHSNYVSPCDYTLCAPFSNGDLQRVYQAIMVSARSQTSTNGIMMAKQHYTVNNTASAYLAGDVIGSNVTFNDLSRVYPLPVEIQDISILDLSGQSPSLIIDIIQYPFTTQTDNTPLDLSGERAKYLGSILILSTDWVVSGGVSRLSLSDINIVVSGIEWSFVITTLDNVTFGTANSLNVKIGVLQN